jgi:hypothetical protein
MIKSKYCKLQTRDENNADRPKAERIDPVMNYNNTQSFTSRFFNLFTYPANGGEEINVKFYLQR